MKSSYAVVSGILLALFAACCSSSHKQSPSASAPAAAPFSLSGSEWLLVDLAGTPVVSDSKASLAFSEAGRISGNASCNRFTGSVTISGDTLKFGPLASTMMACADPKISAQETTYLKALGAAARYTWQDPYLLIYCEGFAKALRFSRAPAAAH